VASWESALRKHVIIIILPSMRLTAVLDCIHRPLMATFARPIQIASLEDCPVSTWLGVRRYALYLLNHR
jgi:hypothetical protein